jgi:hypothetical protein
MTARSNSRNAAKSLSGSAAGLNGARPQSWPEVFNSSGGAPTDTPLSTLC